jgi:hypothetical protein
MGLMNVINESSNIIPPALFIRPRADPLKRPGETKKGGLGRL